MLLQNEAGALARVASVLSSRGYNIESLNVAPTADETVSRLTLVTSGSETVIDQIEKQLGKLVDVVDLADMTKSDHIERELALFKLHVTNGAGARLKPVIEQFGARVLSDTDEHYTVELTSINMLTPAGWRSNMIKAGDRVKAVVAPLLTGEPGCLLLDGTLPDGRELESPVPAANTFKRTPEGR